MHPEAPVERTADQTPCHAGEDMHQRLQELSFVAARTASLGGTGERIRKDVGAHAGCFRLKIFVWKHWNWKLIPFSLMLVVCNAANHAWKNPFKRECG